MAKEVNIYDNQSLSELDVIPGEVIGLDAGFDPNGQYPLLLVIPKWLIKDRKDIDPCGLKLLFYPKEISKREEWTLGYEGNILELWTNDIRVYNSGMHSGVSYIVESAYSGKEAIKKALEDIHSLSFYANWISSGKLVLERSKLGKTLEEVGAGKFLPNQLRVRGKVSFNGV